MTSGPSWHAPEGTDQPGHLPASHDGPRPLLVGLAWLALVGAIIAAVVFWPDPERGARASRPTAQTQHGQ